MILINEVFFSNQHILEFKTLRLCCVRNQKVGNNYMDFLKYICMRGKRMFALFHVNVIAGVKCIYFAPRYLHCTFSLKRFLVQQYMTTGRSVVVLRFFFCVRVCVCTVPGYGVKSFYMCVVSRSWTVVWTL